MSEDDPFEDDPLGPSEPIAPKKKPRRKDRPVMSVVGGSARTLDDELAWCETNDSGNADRLVARYPEALFHVPEKAARSLAWFVWDGVHWNSEVGNYMAETIARKVQLAMEGEIRALEAKNKTEYGDWIARLYKNKDAAGNIGKLRAMLEAAAPRLMRRLDDIDAHPDLLYTRSAVLRLPRYEADRVLPEREPGEDGDTLPAFEVIAHDPAHYVTKLSGAPYDSAAICPLWRRFVAQIFPNPSLRDFVQRAAGLSITGDMSEEVFFLCWGRGRNGKGTFLRTIAAALGGYAATIPVELLLREGNAKTGNESAPQFAVLNGVRYAITTEPDDKAEFHQGTIRTLTGRDRFPIRANYGDPFYLDPQFKLWIACNKKPVAADASEAFWRRVRLIPFVANIAAKDTDPRLGARLMAELPGILNWLVEGARMWARDGLLPPEEVTGANERYRDEMDPLNRFLIQCTVLKPGVDTARANLWWVYLGWCDAMGEKPLSGRGFGLALADKGYIRKMNNGVWYRDVYILDEAFAAYKDKGEELETAMKGRRA